ncbi:MAG TPA: TPM domain-containing protein [Allosphingosinicella sp.]|nr:TPM domain-containing protein [Allosphingosinicella sp.]
MPARILLAALLLLAAPACSRAQAAPPEPQPHFPALTGRVVDQADMLTPAEEQVLTAESAAVERDTKAQYVIATVRSLEGYPIEEYGYKLGRFWGIGRKGVNDGVILLVAPAERKVRIEVGYGLEKRITDPFAATVIRDRILPDFHRGDFGDGIKAASDAIVQRLRSKASDAEIAKEDHLTV